MGKQIAISLLLSLMHVIYTKLLFVFEHCRHGARGPVSGLDKNNFDYIKQKWDIRGELTPVGIRMHYLLGYKNYKRYSGFLSSYPNQKEVLIMSTDINRTIQSVLSQMQGLYPLFNGPQLTETQMKNAYPPNDLSDDIYKPIIADLNNAALPNQMQLFPIQLFDPKDRIYILYESYATSKCKAIDYILKENRRKEKVVQTRKNFNAKYGEQLLKFYNQSNGNDIYDISLIALCDHFIVDLFEDKDLSELTDAGIDLQQFKATCNDVLNEFLFTLLFGDDDGNVALLSLSSSMRQILHYINKRIELDQRGQQDLLDYSAPKMLIHSGHDSSMMGMQIYMQRAFGTPTVNPVFADNMFFELKKKEEELKGDLSDYYIDYYIRDELIKSIPYDEFEKNIRDLLWDDDKIDSFCNMGESRDNKGMLWIVIWMLVSICIILIIAVIALYCIIKKKDDKEKLSDSFSINNHEIYND